MKNPIKVLMVEDNEGDAELLKRMLKKGDYDAHCRRVETQTTFTSALDEQPWDLILCDYRLPGFSGIEALKICRDRDLDIPFIFVSGTMGEEIAVDAMTIGAHDYVMKNNLARLIPAIDRELKEAEVRIERRQAVEALRASESSMQAVLHSTADGILAISSDNKVLYANEQFAQMWKIPKELMASKENSVLLHHVLEQLVDPEVFLKKVQELYKLEEDSFDTLNFKDGRAFERLSRPLVEGEMLRGRVLSFRDITERKRAEEELRESEGKFRTIFDNASDGMFLVDLKARKFFICNATCAKMLGHAQEEFSNLDIGDIYPGEDLPFVNEQIGRFSRGEEGIRSDTRFKRKDGSTFAADLSPALLTIAEKKYLLIVFKDITERKRAEEMLLESELKFRTIFDRALDGILIADLETRQFFMGNSAICQMLGYTPDELSGIGVDDIHPQEHLPYVVEQFKRLERRETNQVENIPLKRKDGSMFYADISSAPITLSGHVYLMGVFRDITERKRAGEALRQSEARYRSVLQSANDAIVTADSNGQISGWNKAAERVFGYSYVEAVGQPLARLLPQSCRPERAKGMTKSETGGDPPVVGKTIEGNGVRKDGTEFPIELSFAAWEVSEGRFYTAVIRDITERKRAEESLAQERYLVNMLIHNVPDHIYFKDTQSRFIRINAALAKIFGLSDPAEAVGKTDADFFTQEHAQKAFDDEQTITRTGQSIVDEEEKETWWDGRVTWVSTTKMPLTDKEGKIVGTFGISRDITERKHAEKRLEEERTLLRTIIDAIPDEISVKDTERRFIVVNTGTLKSLNLRSTDDIIGKRDEDLIPAHLVERAKWEENAVLAVGGHSRNRISDKVDPETGDIVRSLLISKVPLMDGEGKIIGLVGVNRDITELKRTEEMLQKERTLLLTLIESIPDEVCLKDLKHRFVIANRASVKALGAASIGAMIGKTDRDFVPSTYVEAHFAEEDAIVASGKPVINREQTKLDPDTGEIEKCALTTKVPVRDQTGKTIGILVVNRDITDRKKAEEGLRGSEEKFRALFEESKDCIYISSGDGRLLDINATGVEMFGYLAKEELLRLELGRDLYVDEQQRKEFLSRMHKIGFVKDFEATMKRKDGQKLTVLETATAVHDKQGNIVLYRGTIRDVTWQRHLEMQVSQSQKMESLGLLAGGIAHDFNNILGIILGHTAIVERAGEDPALLKSSGEEIAKAVQRGASLVRQILTFARKSDPTLEPVNANATIRELSKMISDTFPKTIAISLDLEKPLPLIMMDQTQLHQALLNLCVNARDAITDASTGNLGRGEIKIKTRTVQADEVKRRFSEASGLEYICISVSDSGMGMDNETKQHIFEPFFTTKQKGKGTGLGLSVVYGVVKTHHGHVEVESEVRKGTTFKVYIPVPDDIASPKVQVESEVAGTYGGKETILLVEDETNLLSLMKLSLEKQGYTVLTATDGLEAIKVFSLNKEKIALVLTDLGLPKLDGAAVVETMKEIDPSVKIILASGYLDPKLKSNLLRSGAKEFIQKPYSPGLVLKTIRRVLDRH